MEGNTEIKNIRIFQNVSKLQNMVGRNYSFFPTDVCRHGFINFLKRSLKRVILKNGFYVQSSLIHEIA